jgi:hypothetical protein
VQLTWRTSWLWSINGLKLNQTGSNKKVCHWNKPTQARVVGNIASKRWLLEPIKSYVAAIKI